MKTCIEVNWHHLFQGITGEEIQEPVEEEPKVLQS